MGLADKINRRRNLGYRREKQGGARKGEEDSKGQPVSHTSSQGVRKGKTDI